MCDGLNMYQNSVTADGVVQAWVDQKLVKRNI
jgi:hypothetical protein